LAKETISKDRILKLEKKELDNGLDEELD